MNRFLILLGCVILFGSCAPKLMFSEDERMKLVENEMDITTVQFYNDKEIVLRRKMNSSDLLVRGGVIKTIDGSQVEEIRIPRYTPCLADSFANNRLYVRFERGDDRQLVFYQNSYRMYQIDAQKWIRGKGKVDYAGKVFFIENTGNDALLVVKKTKDYKNATSSKQVGGMRINDKKKSNTIQPAKDPVPDEQPQPDTDEYENLEEGNSDEANGDDQ